MATYGTSSNFRMAGVPENVPASDTTALSVHPWHD